MPRKKAKAPAAAAAAPQADKPSPPQKPAAPPSPKPAAGSQPVPVVSHLSEPGAKKPAAQEDLPAEQEGAKSGEVAAPDSTEHSASLCANRWSQGSRPLTLMLLLVWTEHHKNSNRLVELMPMLASNTTHRSIFLLRPVRFVLFCTFSFSHNNTLVFFRQSSRRSTCSRYVN